MYLSNKDKDGAFYEDEEDRRATFEYKSEDFT